MASVIGIGLSEITVDAKMPLGFEWTTNDPTTGNPQVWVYVQNGDSGNWVAGAVIGRKDAATTRVGVRLAVSDNPERIMGVCQRAFLQNYYGFILKYGDGLVLADASGIAANLGLVPSGTTAGTADQAAAVTAVCFGWAHTAIAASVTGRAFFNCRG